MDSPLKPSEITDLVSDDDSMSNNSLEEVLGPPKHLLEQELHRGKVYKSEMTASGMNSMMRSMSMNSGGVDEEIQDLNMALSNGNEDFDFRTLSNHELLTLLRGEPTKESFSNISKMTKYLQPDLSKENRTKKRKVASPLKQTQREQERDHLAMSVEYSSLSKWKVGQNSLGAQDSYLNIIKFIILRESSLISIRDVVHLLDHLYWKYANILIARKQYFKNNESCDELKQLRSKIFTKQELLSVAIAHHRSISIDIVEGVQKWRKQLYEDVKLHDVASLYWNNQNYLIKMLHDTTKLFETQTMWMWLGFHVDCFIIPPRHVNPHTERLNREKKFHKWKQKRDDHNTAALKKLMSQTVMYRAQAITDRGTARRQVSISQVNQFGTSSTGTTPIPRRGNLAAEPGSEVLQGRKSSMITSTSASALPPIGPAVQSLDMKTDHTQSAVALTTVPTNSKDTTSSDCNMEQDNPENVGIEEVLEHDEDDDESSICSSSITSMLTDDTGSGWRDLRDSCLPSWNYYLQNRNGDDFDMFDQEEDFWESLDHYEFMMEAAMGYLDLYPKKYIVPPMKKELMTRCHACEQVLLNEVDLAKQVEEKVALSKEMEMDFDKDALHNYLSDLDSEEKQVEKIAEMGKLQHRQESMHVRDHTRHQEISREVVASLLRRGRQSSPQHKFRSLSPPRSAKSTRNQNTFTVFLTTPSLGGTDFTQSTFSCISENVVCKIDKEILRSKIENVVNNDRQACIRLGSSLIIRTDLYRRDRIRAYQNKQAKKRNALGAIIFMQALVRGMITRSRLQRRNNIHAKMNATLFIQRCLLRYVKRCRERVKRRFFKADCLRVRHEILRVHRSSDIIKTFFRYLVYLKKRCYFLNKYSAIERLDVPRMTNVLKSVTKIQALFRGFSVRSWFYKVINESRKRARIGPKYRKKIIQASRRDHNYTVAGSGGFKYWWRNSPEKNSVRRTIARQTTLSTELTVSTTFVTNNSSPNDTPTVKSQHLDSMLSPLKSPLKSGRRDSFGSDSDDSVSQDGMSLSLSLHSDGLAASLRNQEMKKRSNIRGKIAMLKGGSRSHHKGVNLLRAVPVKDREFIPQKSVGQNISSGGSIDGSSLLSRSHMEAYENPNVHFKAKLARSGGLSGSLYSSSLDSKKASELTGFLQNVYGFQK